MTMFRNIEQRRRRQGLKKRAATAILQLLLLLLPLFVLLVISFGPDVPHGPIIISPNLREVFCYAASTTAQLRTHTRQRPNKRRRRKNILLLITDDQDVVLGSFDYMSNVKQYLQSQGKTFTEAFVHTPVCCPSRSSILTGRYLHNNRRPTVKDDCNDDTIENSFQTEYLLAINNTVEGNCYGPSWKKFIEPNHTYAVHAQRLGYRTIYAGKYLNQYGVDDENEEGHATIPNGWDYWYGLVGNSVYYNYDIIEGIPKFHPMSTESNRKMQQHAVVRHRHNNTYPDDYLPLVLRNYTLEMLEKLYGPPRHVDDQDDDDDHTPFLMTVAWPTPHGPFTPEPKNEHTMDDIEAPITPNYNASSVYNHQKHWLLRQLHPISLETSRKINHHYKSRLEALKTVDEHVRDLILKLDELDLLDDTYVIYTSDNGFQFGQHRLAIDKRHLYEHDIRVPFVVRGPGITSNSTSHRLVANIDIAPTILDIVQEGIDKTTYDVSMLDDAIADMDGISIFETDPAKAREDLLISYHGEGSDTCGLTDCPPPFDDIWWMPDSYNNTYHCLRTLFYNDGEGRKGSHSTNTIFCMFQDREGFVEYYNLSSNPHQLENEYSTLSDATKSMHRRRLQELLKVRRFNDCAPSAKQQ